MFENCKIIGTQPKFKTDQLEMNDMDLCFEKSDVEAAITTPVMSIKNPRSGHIYVPSVEEIIYDDPEANGEILAQKQHCCA